MRKESQKSKLVDLFKANEGKAFTKEEIVTATGMKIARIPMAISGLRRKRGMAIKKERGAGYTFIGMLAEAPKVEAMPEAPKPEA